MLAGQRLNGYWYHVGHATFMFLQFSALAMTVLAGPVFWAQIMLKGQIILTLALIIITLKSIFSSALGMEKYFNAPPADSRQYLP